MKAIYGIGDIHLAGYPEWIFKVGDKFIEWLDSFYFGDKKESEVILTGDVTSKDLLPGLIIDQLERLIEVLERKFSHIYICMGNHDLKKWHGKLQHPLIAIGKRPSITVIEKHGTIKTPLGFNVLFLPFQKITGTNCEDFYNSMPPEFTIPYDVIVGHFAKKDNFLYKKGVNTDLFKTREWFLGHIHNRPEKEYLGSVYSLNPTEEKCKYPRCMKKVTKENIEDINLPKFLTYKTIAYPDKPTLDSSMVEVFTVKNCPNKLAAQEYYKELFIKGIEKEKEDIKDVTVTTTSDKTFKNYHEAFDSWISETGTKVSRQVYKLVNSMLKETEEN
ncbi:MAG: hypothetical protein EZS28_042193 [Streblomastix strix]|uniref:Calcineurin-like phosphoesterase domain-containing protein n=1 Tax=Streblomastix strix TaxID=222440 RepID=A0A5J4TW44_9EUKA|nr:MAG: hypothetical protein EZS28_042193 [Streblomastix strix]